MFFFFTQIKAEWDLADKDKSGTLDYGEIVRLLKKLNLKMKDKEIKRRFTEVDTDKNKVLDFSEFTEFLNRLRVREEINELFEKLTANRGILTAQELMKFYETVQKVNLAFFWYPEINFDVTKIPFLFKGKIDGTRCVEVDCRSSIKAGWRRGQRNV